MKTNTGNQEPINFSGTRSIAQVHLDLQQQQADMQKTQQEWQDNINAYMTRAESEHDTGWAQAVQTYLRQRETISNGTQYNGQDIGTGRKVETTDIATQHDDNNTTGKLEHEDETTSETCDQTGDKDASSSSNTGYSGTSCYECVCGTQDIMATTGDSSMTSGIESDNKSGRQYDSIAYLYVSRLLFICISIEMCNVSVQGGEDSQGSL